MKKSILISGLLPTALVALTALGTSKPGPAAGPQPVLGARSANTLTQGSLRFKDLNANGQLDPYEDWRLPAAARAADLLARMSLPQKVGFMLISDTRLRNEGSPFGPPPKEPPTGEFSEDDVVQSTNPFTRAPLPAPVMNAAGTTKGVAQLQLRHFIFRANTGARLTAEWANRLQALCESQPLGIPALVTSNPRNHVTAAAAAGTSVGQTAFCAWPGELGLAAMRDLPLTREFADLARQEWVAVGLRKGYMYMGDLATEPRWQRIEGTFGENADWAGQMLGAVVEGFQGRQLGPQSVALTVKHFPGGGAAQNGQDPHFAFGKNEVFPGGMLANNLVPFRAAIRAGASSVMPYYSVPQGTPYPAVAYTYDQELLRGVLRQQLGFEGIINSDTGPIEMMPWGVEQLTVAQRYQRALEAGVNLFGGNADPALLLAVAQAQPTLLPLIDDSVRRLLKEEFALGLFENPYVDAAAAEKTVNTPHMRARAALALRKSVVLLRNRQLLPLQPGTKVYAEIYHQPFGPPTPATGGTAYLPPAGAAYPVTFVATPEAADVILLWLQPTGRPLFASDGSPLQLSLSKCAVNVEYVKQLMAKKPTVLVINYSSPWVVDEVYNDQAPGTIRGVLATFGTTPDALLDVVTGRFRPTGKMPFTTPISEAAVLHQKEDVPGYLEGPAYPLFKYGEGLGY